MRPKILVTKRVYPQAIEYLREHAEVDYNDSSDGYSPAELLDRLKDKAAVVSQLTDKFTAAVMDASPALKVIANVAVGFDNIDVDAATQRKVVVTNTPEVLTETTADFAFTLLMAAARRVVEGDRFLRTGQWRQWQIDLLCGHDVHHATLGVLGMGRIGQGVARRGLGFEMKVLYHDVVPAAPGVEEQLHLQYVPFETLLRESDFVSLHVPLRPETRHLIGAKQLALMKPTAILINTSRGPVVDEAALADALENHRIGGAALDVFEREPEVEPRLLALDNVVLEPHIASASVATRTKMSLMAAENAVVALDGRRPPNLVNGALFDSN
jgi:lactate dehydrogenase-like 2-hydroxyacid dehydrogenase